MPVYSNTPPADPRGRPLPIRRTPAARPLVVVITSEDLVGCFTHYYGGRTVPCEAPDCPACQDQTPYRWHAYIGVLETRTHEHVLLELTAQATDPLIAYRARHGTLRGCLIEATRAHNRQNGRVVLRCKPADLQQINLPPPPSIERALSILWNLPIPGIPLRSAPRRAGLDSTTPTGDTPTHAASTFQTVTAAALRGRTGNNNPQRDPRAATAGDDPS